MTEKSRIKQKKTIKDKYGTDHYKWMAEQRWNKPGAKENIKKDRKGRFISKTIDEGAKDE